MKLFLFDIDGTIISTLGEGSLAFRKAYYDLFCVKLKWPSRKFAGRTDEYISQTSLELIGANTEINRRSLLDAYIINLKKKLFDSPPLILPGVHKTIAIIKNQKNSVLGLLTGNIISGAKIKLGTIFSHFELGAFGDNTPDRNSLPEVAYSLFKKRYGSFPKKVFIIGDTPYDIKCAKVGKAKSIAVTTGPYNKKELKEADFILDDLRAWEENQY